MNDRRTRFDAEILPHLDAAYRFATWLSRSPTDAEDIVQDALVRAFRSFDGMRGAEPKAWLLTIVRNCHATAAARGRRLAHVPLPEEHDIEDGHAMIASTPGPEAAAISDDLHQLLGRLMSTLSDEHREILLLREIEDLDYRQIAAVTQLPIGTVMSRLARARAALLAAGQQKIEGATHAVR